MHRSILFTVMAVIVVLMGEPIARGGEAPARRPYCSVLPVTKLKTSELTQVPICVVNNTDRPIQVALDQSGLRSVDVRVERDGKILSELEAIRTDIASVPKRDVRPGDSLLTTLNLTERFGARQLSPGVYVVSVMIRSVGEAPKPSEVQSSQFVLSVITDAE